MNVFLEMKTNGELDFKIIPASFCIKLTKNLPSDAAPFRTRGHPAAGGFCPEIIKHTCCVSRNFCFHLLKNTLSLYRQQRRRREKKAEHEKEKK